MQNRKYERENNEDDEGNKPRQNGRGKDDVEKLEMEKVYNIKINTVNAA